MTFLRRISTGRLLALCGAVVATAAACAAIALAATGGGSVPPPKPLTATGVRLARDGSVRFTLSAPATGTVTIKRGGRKVLAKKFTGVAGANRVRTRKLKPGRYVVAITAAGADGKVARTRVNRTISRPG